MKFYPLTREEVLPDADLRSEYQDARDTGVIRLGEHILFFRRMRKVYYVSYRLLTRCFRRVMLVPAKMCCGSGDLAVENLVLCTQEGEIAQIQLPGERAGKIILEALKKKVPDAEFVCPKQD